MKAESLPHTCNSHLPFARPHYVPINYRLLICRYLFGGHPQLVDLLLGVMDDLTHLVLALFGVHYLVVERLQLVLGSAVPVQDLVSQLELFGQPKLSLDLQLVPEQRIVAAARLPRPASGQAIRDRRGEHERFVVRVPGRLVQVDDVDVIPKVAQRGEASRTLRAAVRRVVVKFRRTFPVHPDVRVAKSQSGTSPFRRSKSCRIRNTIRVKVSLGSAIEWHSISFAKSISPIHADAIRILYVCVTLLIFDYTKTKPTTLLQLQIGWGCFFSGVGQLLTRTVAHRTVAHPDSCSPGHLLTKQMKKWTLAHQ